MHPTQRALLKAVAAAPNDDTPRLVYADWLDEHAADLPKKEREATAARAEIIRAQCELARLAEEDTEARWVDEFFRYKFDSTFLRRVDWSAINPGVARRVALRARQVELLSAFGKKWSVAELVPVKGIDLSLHRGFWTNLSVSRGCPLANVLDAHTQQRDAIPSEYFNCDRDLTPEEAQQLARAPTLQHVQRVGGDMQRPTLYAALAESGVAATVPTVDVSCYYSDTLLPLAKKRTWGGLRNCHIVSHGESRLTSLTHLARAKHLHNLDSLSIFVDGYNTQEIVEAVAGGPWAHLRRLEFDRGVNDGGARAIAESPSMRQLRYASLGHTVEAVGATALLSAPGPSGLVVLALQGDPNGLDMRMLKRAERPALRVLDLPVYSKADLERLARTPAIRHLYYLAIGTRLHDPHVAEFVAALDAPDLALLPFGGRRGVGPLTAKALAAHRGLGKLQALDLSGTTIGATGGTALARSKHLGNLRFLDVSDAGVPEPVVGELRKRFGKDAVRG